MMITNTRVRLGNPGAVLDALRNHMAEHDIEISEIDGVLVAALPRC